LLCKETLSQDTGYNFRHRWARLTVF
jgi:hypothetical protein